MRYFTSTQTFESKRGHLITILPYEEKWFPLLLRMYDDYRPLGSVQGLPPIDRDKRHEWLQGMINNGTNLLAMFQDTVIGHASLFAIPVNWVEYFIFIHQGFQRQGIGTAISSYVIEWADHENISTIWLSVERKNYIAIALYRKVGFKRIGSSGDCWEMIFTLTKEQ